jgi:hypothetical protein
MKKRLPQVGEIWINKQFKDKVIITDTHLGITDKKSYISFMHMDEMDEKAIFLHQNGYKRYIQKTLEFIHYYDFLYNNEAEKKFEKMKKEF